MGRRPYARTIPIDQVAAGTTELVPARPGKTIRVQNYTVIMDGAGTYKFRTGSRDLTGAMPAEDRGGAAPAGSEDSPLMNCDRGENLTIVTTTGAAKGHLTYETTPGG